MTSTSLFKRRKTSKVLSSEPLEGSISEDDLADLVAAASWAPFHYTASAQHREQLADGAPEPWRFYILEREACGELRNWLLDSGDMSKVPDMLAGANALVQVTWCPNPAPESAVVPEGADYYPTDINLEHIAATAAAIQNLLLCATDKGIPSYWSSGGSLRSEAVFDRIGIPRNQVLLGSVFLFPEDVADMVDGDRVKIVPGKMRDKRSTGQSWCHRVTGLQGD